MEVEPFHSIPADQPNKSFCLSQYAMLKRFLETEGKTLLTFEDDVIFQDLQHFEAACSELPAEWDMVYLGANITDMVFGIKEYPPVRYSEHLYQVKRAWTTHAVGYSRKMADIIVRHYPVQEFNMFDNWLNENILPHYKCFLINPMVAWQRPGISDLWGGVDTDYTGAFEWGNKFMKQ